MDTSLVHALNHFFVGHDGVEDPVVGFVDAAEVLFLGMLVVAFLVVWGQRRRTTQRAVVAAGASAGVALAIAQVLSRVVERPRPFVAHPEAVHLFARHAADSSFPSDHATAAFAIGVALLLRQRAWGAIVLVLATVLAVGRVAMGIHYPSDVIAGASLGGAVAVALWTGPVRQLLERVADAVGGALDGALGAAWAARSR
jgi:undecaprenyl-diphosphatase